MSGRVSEGAVYLTTKSGPKSFGALLLPFAGKFVRITIEEVNATEGDTHA